MCLCLRWYSFCFTSVLSNFPHTFIANCILLHQRAFGNATNLRNHIPSKLKRIPEILIIQKGGEPNLDIIKDVVCKSICFFIWSKYYPQILNSSAKWWWISIIMRATPWRRNSLWTVFRSQRMCSKQIKCILVKAIHFSEKETSSAQLVNLLGMKHTLVSSFQLAFLTSWKWKLPTWKFIQ